jgi:hypothetical protein
MIEGRHDRWYYKDAALRSELDKSGCRFEDLILGGQLHKIVADTRELIDETLKVGFLSGILGLAIKTTQGDMTGYRIIPDEIIRGVVDSGGELPPNQDCFEAFIADTYTEPVYIPRRLGLRVYVRELKQVCRYCDRDFISCMYRHLLFPRDKLSIGYMY